MNSFEALAKAFANIRDNYACTFTPEEFGSEWQTHADSVLDILEGLKCDVDVQRASDRIVLTVLD